MTADHQHCGNGRSEAPLRLLLVEDSESDAALVVRILDKAGFAVTHQRVQTIAEMHEALARTCWDLVISDYSLPQFNAGAALEMLQSAGLDLPFIVVSGTIGEEQAVSLMRAGAHDYLLKDNLTRLPPAVTRELHEARVRRERCAAQESLQESQARFRAFAASANDAIITIDSAGIIHEWNPAAQFLFGHSEEEAIGRPVTLIIPPRHQSNHERGLANRRNVPRTKSVGTTTETEGLRLDGTEFPIELSLSSWRLGRDEYFTAIIRDLTERKQAQDHERELMRERDQALQDRERYLCSVQKALEDGLQAIATALEYRDAYTAGHQRRVAELAVAIAREMGLEEHRIHGIRLAGVAHDIGKIQVPAEILAKPTRLNEAEFALIRMHSQVGYDILKDIDFPWPIAQTVLQHHERIDGSGYPNGIMGEAILLEARIIGVADVVEAMASHRPYRPGQGVEKALDEISCKAGSHFDSQVVAACTALFRERGYALNV